MNHTRGPWRAAPDGDAVSGDLWCVLCDESHEYLASVVGTKPLGRAEADAHLMAAAPDLYGALVDAAKFLADTEYSDEAYAALEVCQAAIAKARGEA